MSEIYFMVEGNPRGKQRPRFANGHAYTPRATREYEDEIRRAYQETCRVWGRREMFPADVPLAVDVKAYKQMPRSWSKAKKREFYCTPCQSKPDADNIAKAVLDALNGTAYTDDKQVTDIAVCKFWGSDGFVLITIKEAENVGTGGE